MPINNARKALGKIAQKQLGLSDKEYRKELAAIGVKSLADPKMTDAKFSVLMRNFKAMGFVQKGKKSKDPYKAALKKAEDLPQDRRGFVMKIVMICRDLKKPLAWANGTVKKSTSGREKTFWFCSPDELYAVVQILSIEQQKIKGEVFKKN